GSVIGHDGPVHDEASAEADPTLDAAQEQAPEAVAPPSARLLADFLSAEKDRVLAAMWAVYATRDDEILLPLARQVSQIRRATADIDLGGIVASHRATLEHALDRLTLAGSGRCRAAPTPRTRCTTRSRRRRSSTCASWAPSPTRGSGRPTASASAATAGAGSRSSRASTTTPGGGGARSTPSRAAPVADLLRPAASAPPRQRRLSSTRSTPGRSGPAARPTWPAARLRRTP